MKCIGFEGVNFEMFIRFKRFFTLGAYLLAGRKAEKSFQPKRIIGMNWPNAFERETLRVNPFITRR